MVIFRGWRRKSRCPGIVGIGAIVRCKESLSNGHALNTPTVIGLDKIWGELESRFQLLRLLERRTRTD